MLVAGLSGRARGSARLGGIELGELLAFLAAEGPGGAALLGLLLAQLEACEARIDVGPPRAEIHRAPHRLAILAVVDDIDAGLGLLTDDVVNGRAQPRLQLLVGCVGRIERHQIVRPRQAADVSGENSLVASLHARLPLRRLISTICHLAPEAELFL